MKKTIVFFTWIGSITVSGQKTVPFADSIRKAYQVPEISYAVADARSILELAALGKHSVDLPDTATLDDRFHIGSNTKAMTAFIAARLVEKGTLKWETRYFDLYPEWKRGSRSDYYAITLKDLLCHRAGIQPFQGENDPPVPPFTGNNQATRKQFGQFVLTLEPVRPDDNNPFVYSNAGYTLAALMMEKATGKSWEQLVEQVFNRDLHLAVKLASPNNQQYKDTWGHRAGDGRLIPVPATGTDHLAYTEPAGDINIRLRDYIRFIQLNLRGLAGEANYLMPATYRFLHKAVPNYSMGWFNIYENGKELSTHGGTAETYYTLVQIDRIKNRAYIIFTNSYSDGTLQAVRLLMRKLKENYGS